MKSSKRGALIVLSGPSGAGKSTVVAELKKTRQIYFSISCTTRDPRPGEKHGVHYYFITRAEFEDMIQRDEFLEHAEYQGNCYGTPGPVIEEYRSKGYDVILDIEVQGAAQIRKKVPDAVLCFMIPPTYEELKRRLYARNTETAEVIEGRLARAKEEITLIPEYDYLVINDVAADAAAELSAIMDAAACRTTQRADYIEEEFYK